MPRPGPRPYECIRRAWHSDSHHPLRGSLIQEIFRVADEIHSSTTRRNKEWQKKLPLVVLRAEEILYSKANSEAEYMDLKTLRSRVEDAVNTMIRRDESTEDGQYLEPCVEAALYVGCPPRKAPRSQRHNSRFCTGSSQRLNTSSAAPVIGKCNNYEGSSLVIQANTQESRFNSAEYRAGVASSFPSIDHQKYSIMPINVTPGCPSSVVCTRVENKPSLNEATFHFPNPCSAGHITPLTFNQGVPSTCPAPSIEQKYSFISQKGLLVHPPTLQTRMDTRMVCMPVPWPMSSASTSSSVSTPWGVPTSFHPEVLNEPAIGLSYHAERLSSVVAEAPTVPIDSELRFQVPSMLSQSSYHSGAKPGKHVAELGSFDEAKYNTHTTYKQLQNNAITGLGDPPAELECKTSTENACDLHLRLGLSSNSCFYTATNESSDVEDLESTNSRARAQVEDRSLENLKVNDSFGSGSCESNQEFLCFSPSLNSGVDVLEAFSKEKKGLDFDRHTIMQAADFEMPHGKRRRCGNELAANQLDDRSTGQQHDTCALQMDLGLYLSGRGGDMIE
eukprot:Gb_03081 [translate_table: standard]